MRAERWIMRSRSTLANIASSYDNDVERSIALSDRALARDPSHVQAMVERAFILVLRTTTSAARISEALRQLDPLNGWVSAIQAMSLACVDRLDEALDAARASVELDHNAFTGRWAMVW